MGAEQRLPRSPSLSRAPHPSSGDTRSRAPVLCAGPRPVPSTGERGPKLTAERGCSHTWEVWGQECHGAQGTARPALEEKITSHPYYYLSVHQRWMEIIPLVSY